MEARGGLIEDVEGLARVAPAQFGRQLDALRLSARKRGAALPQLDVAQAHIGNRADLAHDARDALEEGHRLIDVHVQHIVDGLALVAHLQRLAVVAPAAARGAEYAHIGQEVHRYGLYARAKALIAATAGHVEREATGLVAAYLRFGQAGKEVADVGENARVSGRIAARGATYGVLVYGDHLIQIFQPHDGLVGHGLQLAAVQFAAQYGVERLVDQGRFATARNPRDADELAQRESAGHVLEVVARNARDAERAPAALAERGAVRNGVGAVEMRGGERIGLHQIAVGALTHNAPTVDTRLGADVDHMVGRHHHVLVVLHHDDRIARVAQFLQGIYQALVVALMQAYAGLVQNVEYPNELRPDLRGKADALRLASRKGACLAVERQIVQPHIEQKLDAGLHLFDDLVGDEGPAFVQFGIQRGEPQLQLAKVHGR